MGKGYVFDMHGLMGEEAQGHGEPARLAEAWKGLEKDVVNGADYVIVVSNAMKRMVCASYGKPPDKVIVAANGSDVYPRPAHFAMPFKIVYAGNFAYYEAVWDFVRTAETVPCEKHEFVLIGDGVLKRDLLRYVGGRHLNVIYRGKRTREETLVMLSESQVGIAPSTKDIVRQVACPLKVLDYAACGLPVVTVDVGEWSDTIREYDCGIVTDESDPAAFADAIRRLEDEDLWRRKSSNGRYMVGEKFTWSRVLQPMLALYRA